MEKASSKHVKAIEKNEYISHEYQDMDLRE